jgi:HEAT repeat protein
MGTLLSLKKQVREALAEADFQEVARLALENKKVFGILISLSFNKEDIVSWRAIEAMGSAAGLVTSEKDPEMVRNAVRRIIWSAREESGGMGWSAPELLGEIVYNAPRAFRDIPPLIVSLHNEDEEGVFRRGVLWALGRMAEAGINEIAGSQALVLSSLSSTDSRIRGLAAYAAGKMGVRQAVDTLKDLSGDSEQFMIYQDANLVQTTVGEQAAKALEFMEESAQG